jgi:hypothetical protein
VVGTPNATDEGIPSSAFMPLSLNTHRNSPQQNATKYPTKKRNPVKKDILERKYVAAKVAKFWLFFSAWQALFVFFSFTVLCPENWGAATANLFTFFSIQFLAFVLFFLYRADAKFPLCFALFFLFLCLFFVPFFCCGRSAFIFLFYRKKARKF